MDFKNFYKSLFLLIFFFSASSLFAQTTVITGTVTDAGNKQTLPYVVVSFTGTTVGVATDNDGKYRLVTSQAAYKQIKISFLGYKDAFLAVEPGKEQVINIRLFPLAKQLNEVVIKSGKKPKYHNKDNPAVELIRKVIENKPKNRPEAYDYVQYREYDKMMFGFINVSAAFSDRKFFRKYKFVIDNRDSTILPGKSILPIYLDEKLSQVYYRKNPEKDREILLGQKGVNFGPAVDNEGVKQYFKHLYNKVDIYENDIFLITSQFLSPISNNSPNYYKFFITDTITDSKNQKLVELSFTPRNSNDVLFEGMIYVTLDGNYAVQKAVLKINKHININFIRSMEVDLDFDQAPSGRYLLSRSNTIAEFGATKKEGKSGLLGMRTITYKNYILNKALPDTAYTKQSEESSDEAKNRSAEFWKENRLDTLSTAESKVYKNIDSLRSMPSYKRTVDIATLVLAGYKGFGKFELGPANTFYSFNPVEGLRLRIGGRTTPELSKRYYFETYAAYGFKDEKWKYFLSATYSLNAKSIYKFPQNYIRASYQKDTKIPGANLQFVQEDNFLLSFKRGVNDKYLYNDFYRLDYVHELESHLSLSAGFKNWKQAPAGSLYFNNIVDGLPNSVHDLTTTELTASVRWSPHEEFYQGKIYRIPIPNKYPTLELDYAAGIKSLFNGQYNYQKLDFRIDKRLYLSQLGYSDLSISAGKIFGQVPFPLLTIHQANQTYAYDIDSYNLMNFLEFASDKYASFRIDHHFGGFFFNKIPLFKKLKWREVTSAKVLYGGISDKNNPSLHPSLYQLPVDASGVPITYALGRTPYVEGSVGIENIFKFIRIDFVKRFNYLDHPDVPSWGIRTRVKFDF
ncbi:DUF5686 and carboxypeptidase-like regulatory domain-containing protein [Mucilaginibacter sp. SP1R1]|uniref:DUF5686 and carboxypeptidase-like regulatory domain-containing protein n=1 Tax=Mucilaginibacter sp. SP1R1 TaxID=2723091 RepID=UPI0016165F12|nr:DUF5686 and carboxypeptidase-like regulatory domain-containing protein [Mucilaginibacter sp. SP1R1]MBB6148240.1 hypothetical protein [Mucilaginibacter sp. SP1R1]